MEKPYTADELKELLTELTRQHYNNSAPTDLISDLSEASDPGRLAVSLIEAIAKVWAENNRRLEDYSRRTGYGGGRRF